MCGNDIAGEARVFYAHSLTGRPPREWQTLEAHLTAVARLAKRFGDEFGAGDWAYVAGLWHDIGKHSDEFQKKIAAANGENAHIETIPGRVDHSTAGAMLAEAEFKNDISHLKRILDYVIAGHHAGLADWVAGLDVRLKKKDRLSGIIDRIPSHIRNLPLPQQLPRPSSPPNPLALSLWVRMIFSCVLDADFLDTEAFNDPKKRAARAGYPGISELIPIFDDYIARLVCGSPRTKVNELREAVRLQCLEKADHPPGIFTLSVPTGGGKTLSSMAFALNHAHKFMKRRIIYVIPYTSIIEQTADELRKALGKGIVVEHHSNLDEAKLDKEDARSRLACENWDAPIIVTTVVQFFESLFASRTSRCRKIHNIGNSVLILDEAQLLPPECLLPILETIKELAASYGVTVVLSTATQPALSPRSDSDFSFPGIRDAVEIVENPTALYESLKRARFVIPSKLESPETWEEIAAKLKMHETALCIVNSRRDCRTLHGLMPEGSIHLSALMCGAHRSRVIGKIKDRLKDGIPTCVISTQLVEAGVDLDFPVVFRALTGLDELAQAAGRCNREGRAAYGTVFVFVPPSPAPPGHLRQAAEIGRRLLGKLTNDSIPLKAFDEYFRELYWLKGEDLDRRQVIPSLLNNPEMKYAFRTAAEAFKIIDQPGWPCLVRYGDGGELIDRLCESGKDRQLMRRLQRYAVQISDWHLRKLLAGGDVVEPENMPGTFMQVNTLLYREDIGLCFPDDFEAYSPPDLVI